MLAIYAAAIGLGFTAGLALIVSGIVRVVRDSKTGVGARPANTGIARARHFSPVQVAAAALAGIGVFATTGWIAGGLVGASIGWCAPSISMARRERTASRERLRAIAGWIETIRDLMSSAAGLEEAVRIASEMAPAMLAGPTSRLTNRIPTVGFARALTAFGEELADPIVDYIVAALIIGSEQGSSHLNELLTTAASTVRAQVSTRERIEASRAGTFTSASTMLLITVLMIFYMVMTQSGYMAWYGTFAGQCILLLVGALMSFGLLSLNRMSRPPKGLRLPYLPTDELGATLDGVLR